MNNKMITKAQITNAVQVMEEYNLNPLEELARLASEAKGRQDDLTVESICKFLMPYVYPKQKTVDMNIELSNRDEKIIKRLNRGRQMSFEKKVITRNEMNFY